MTKVLQEEFRRNWETNIQNAHIADENSKLGVYLIVNPTLKFPNELSNIIEYERIVITRFRTGTHNLRIESGRINNVQRNERICTCGTNLQTIAHFLIECPSLLHVRGENHKNSVSECLKSRDIIPYMLQGAKILGIEL